MRGATIADALDDGGGRAGATRNLFDWVCLRFDCLQLVKVDEVVVAIVVVRASEMVANCYGGHLLPFHLPSFEGGYLRAVSL